MAADLTPAGLTPVGPIPAGTEEDQLAPGVPPDQPALPLPPSPSVLATVDPATTTEQITCPECGTIANVILTERDARDFCRTCDYPLFWVPTRVPMGRGDLDAGSLRRLPGTLGRATVASLDCPHCNEPNVVTALICVRCQLALHQTPAPQPAPVPLIELEHEPEPEPELEWRWWPWVLAILVVATIFAILVYFVATQRL